MHACKKKLGGGEKGRFGGEGEGEGKKQGKKNHMLVVTLKNGSSACHS